MRYYAEDELDQCVLTRTGEGVEVVTLGRTIAISRDLLAQADTEWLKVENDGEVVTLCGRYRYRHIGMTIRSEPVYTLVRDLEAA